LQAVFGKSVSSFVKRSGICSDGAIATQWTGRYGTGEGPGGNDSAEVDESGIKGCGNGSAGGFSDVEQLPVSGII
jgi:hypothetical protein